MRTRSVRVKIGETEVTLVDKGVCRKCGEQVVKVGLTDLWLHVGFVKGQKTYRDYGHRAQA